MKINKLNLVLLSSLIGIHAIQAAEKQDKSLTDSASTKLTATTTMSPLKAAKEARMRKAQEAAQRLGLSTMSASTPVPSTVMQSSAILSDPILGSTTTVPATTTTSSSSSSSSSSKLDASRDFGDDNDDDNLLGLLATSTPPKSTTKTKSDHQQSLRLLEEQFKAAEEKSRKVFQGKITDLSKELLHVQAALTAAKKENGDKDQQLVIVQGLHDTQKAEVTRLQSELKAKKDELATLEANAAKGSSVVDAEKIQQLTAELEKSNKELDDSKALLKTLNQENDRLVTDKLNLKGEIDAKVQSLAKLTQVQADLTAANQRVTEADRLKGVAETELVAAKLRLADAEHLKAEAEAAKIQAEGKNKTDGEVIEALKKDLDQARQYVTEAKDRLTIVEEARAKLQGEFNKAEANIKTLQGALTTAEKKNTDLKDNLSDAANTKAAELKAQQVRLENEHNAAMEAAASSHRVQLAERDEEQNEILVEFSKVCLSLAKNKLGLGGDQKLTLEQVQNALSDNPLFAAMMVNETLRDLLSETAEAFSNSTPLNNSQLVASASSRSPILGNDSDDDGAATTITQGANSSKKSNQAGNGNGGRGGKKRGGKK
ncbi:MAG: hypothetical protein FJX03_06965 [Alphaproteobacteria bacterium]|nr:hypothetical protein [Alphaproteobacteria bacterium]